MPVDLSVIDYAPATPRSPTIRRALLILPFIVPFALHTLYQPINAAWTVERFGCGCPPVRDPEAFRFNANHFNMILWSAISLACGLSWWFLVRSEFVDRRSTRYLIVQSVGLTLLLCTCVNRLAKEIWL
jgi:hypothetical protein